jgi:hypothetical protein
MGSWEGGRECGCRGVGVKLCELGDCWVQWYLKSIYGRASCLCLANVNEMATSNVHKVKCFLTLGIAVAHPRLLSIFQIDPKRPSPIPTPCGFV